MIVLQLDATSMGQRKSAPQLRVIPSIVRPDADVTVVDRKPAPPPHRPAPPMTARPAPMAAPNMIPFAKPRAIAALPATFGANRSPRSTPPPFVVEAPTLVDAPTPVVVAPPPVVVAPPATKWAAFEKLERFGIAAPKLDIKGWSKHVVSAYRVLGFSILTIIVIVLVGYIVTTAFYYMSDSWVVPMAISPTDEKVVALEAQFAERENQRDMTAALLDESERAIAVQQLFQAEFAKAIKSDLDGRRAALDKMHELASAAASTRVQIRRSNSAWASASQARMAEEYKAGLIDRNAMLSGKFQLAQISSSNLSLAERQAEYETRAADLESQTRSLDALLANKSSEGALSYDVLKIKQEYETSRLETEKAIETRDTLKTALQREDKLLGQLKQSSYLRALADHAQVAFVPYGNLHTVDKGAGLYACRLGMVICHKVGTVLEVLPGEVQFKHPHRDKMLRGQMVELQLEDGNDATGDVLFVGGRPLLL